MIDHYIIFFNITQKFKEFSDITMARLSIPNFLFMQTGFLVLKSIITKLGIELMTNPLSF